MTRNAVAANTAKSRRSKGRRASTIAVGLAWTVLTLLGVSYAPTSDASSVAVPAVESVNSPGAPSTVVPPGFEWPW